MAREAAAQAHFGKPAARLNREEAARLAAVLPNPIRMNAGNPSRYVLRRQRQIEAQMRALGGTAYLRKLRPGPGASPDPGGKAGSPAAR